MRTKGSLNIPLQQVSYGMPYTAARAPGNTSQPEWAQSKMRLGRIAKPQRYQSADPEQKLKIFLQDI